MVRAASALAAVVLVSSGAGTPQERLGAVHGQVVRVPVSGEIELGLAPFVERSLREAEEVGAAAVILDLDTPGGRVDAAWAIIDAVRDAEVPVFALVNRRALSAGAMIALSADRLYMRPGSTIGAATPVVGAGDKASEKLVSAMRSEFRGLAEERGFDPRIAEAMVDESLEVPDVVEAGRLLTLTTTEAVRLGVATGQVTDYEALLQTIGLAGAPSMEVRPNWSEKIVRFLTSSAVAPLLLSLGFLGLLIEIKTPSFGFAGGVGLICLAAFFGARYLVNLAGMEELLLLALGVALIVIEVVAVPGMGLLGVLGGLMVLASAFMSMLGRFPTFGDVIGAGAIISASVIVVALLAFALLRHLPHSRSLSGILLKSATTRDTGYISAPKRDDLIGRTGTALTDLRPSGTVRIDGERIDVVTEGPWIEGGATVEVVRSEGYRHVVREVAIPEPGTDSA